MCDCKCDPVDVGPEQGHSEAAESAIPDGVSTTTSTRSGNSGKKKKPRKRAKKGTVLPSLTAAEERLLWKTRHSATLGRHAVAKQSIAKGQRILVEEAVVALPRQRFSSVLCHQCLKGFSEFQALERDKDVPSAFCSAECHRASAEFDPEVAAVMEELTQIASNTNCDLDLLIFVVKLKAVQQDLAVVDSTENGEGAVPWWVTEDSTDPPMKTGWGDVRGLVRNWDKMGSDWKKSVTDACKAVRERLKQIPRFADVELCELQELAATVNTNSHGLGSAGGENTDLALGLFPVLSMFNHSCDPNCCFLGSGRVMTVRALKDIEAGEQLTVSYLNLMEPRWLRQQILQEARYFTCTCPRCSEDIHTSTDRFLEGVKCPLGKCSGLLVGAVGLDGVHSIWTCQDCQISFTSAHKHTSYQHPTLQAQEEPRSCCHGGGGSCCQRNLEAIADDALPSIDKYFKAGKDGNKTSAFDPGAILGDAQESLSKAMEAYSKRNLLQAIRLLEHHIATFEPALNPHHVCIFDALTPLLNCYRSFDDANSSLKVCQRTLQSFDKVLKSCSLEQSNFQKILGDLYRQKMHTGQTSSKSTVVRKLMKKQAQEAFRKCHEIRLVCCGPTHASTREAIDALQTL